MTGKQLRLWRQNHDKTLRELAADLGGQVHYSTITGWETDSQGEKEIPKWASDKILGQTQITLPLDELHQLLDASREDNLPAQQLIAKAIQQYLQARQQRAAKKGVPPEIIERETEIAGTKLKIISPTQYKTGGEEPDSKVAED